MSSPLIPYITNYAEAKQRFPTEGRRRWKLRVAQQFWAAVGSGGPLAGHGLPPGPVFTVEFENDADPLDGVSRDVPALGLIVRTDFTDEPAWAAFCTRLRESEEELIRSNDQVDDSENTSRATDHTGVDEGDQDDDDDDPPPVFHIIDPPSPQERELLANISNLAALRLFNDVDVRPSPTLPQGERRVNPPNRLVDYCGWQEIYQGKDVWIYDQKSNTDQCVRVVSKRGDMYGTATGDSWRARVSHICDLQVNLAAEAIRIDFGGLDRWDFNERRRNMTEAEWQSQ